MISCFINRPDPRPLICFVVHPSIALSSHPWRPSYSAHPNSSPPFAMFAKSIYVNTTEWVDLAFVSKCTQSGGNGNPWAQQSNRIILLCNAIKPNKMQNPCPVYLYTLARRRHTTADPFLAKQQQKGFKSAPAVVDPFVIPWKRVSARRALNNIFPSCL